MACQRLLLLPCRRRRLRKCRRRPPYQRLRHRHHRAGESALPSNLLLVSQAIRPSFYAARYAGREQQQRCQLQMPRLSRLSATAKILLRHHNFVMGHDVEAAAQLTCAAAITSADYFGIVIGVSAKWFLPS